MGNHISNDQDSQSIIARTDGPWWNAGRRGAEDQVVKDLQDQKLVLEAPKSGKEQEIVFIPQKVAERLRDYALQLCKKPEDRIFPISYEAARVIVMKVGKLVKLIKAKNTGTKPYVRPCIHLHGWLRLTSDVNCKLLLPLSIVYNVGVGLSTFI
ncbi:hypothetical protein JCM12296A_23160 [Desulfosarcina cetonica]